VLRVARAADEWAGGAPLIFGGDLNLRPAEDPELFARLAEDFGLDSPVTGARMIDHVFVRGLDVVAAPVQWPPERRELSLDGKALRLSDHAPVEARFWREDPPVLAN
jgi:endonuclease/exonuclease/phosphatase (EEP) superfamily protein YafD